MEKAIERVFKFLKDSDIKHTRFEKEIGLSNGYLNTQLKRKANLGEEILNKIIDNCLHINPTWLLTGEGEMLRNNTPCIVQEHNVGVPYYDVDFSGGFNAIFNNQTLLPDHNIVFAPFADAQLWCNVTGNSMAEKISHGDIIALKELPNWDENVLYGEIYAVVTEHLRTIKVIRKSKDENRFRLVPLNKVDHDENEIKKDSIIKVFEVLGAIKKFF